MVKFKVSALLPMPADAYFVERDSAAFRSLVAEMCKLESLEIGNSWMEGATEIYEFVTRPDIERYVPPQFKHLLPGGDLHYTDIIEYDPQLIQASPYRMRVRSVPPIFASKAKIESWLVIEAVGPDSCRQTLEGSIEIKILGLGGLAERIIVENLKGVYKGVPKIVERWAKFRREVLAQPGGQAILVQGRPRNEGVGWINDRIRALIRARDSDSDLPSHPSDRSSDTGEGGHSRTPSMEELLARSSGAHSSSGEESSVDGDLEFFDARENVSWLDLADSLGGGGGDARLSSSLQRDTQAAREALAHARKSGRRLRRLAVDGTQEAAAPASTAGEPAQAGGGRFSTEYNEELREWRSFWQEHQVPESSHLRGHSGRLRSRLANLFHIGAAVGMFKPGKRHHRWKLRNSDSHGSGASAEEAAAAAAAHEDAQAGELQAGKPGGGKGHRRSRSATFVRDLFTRGRKPHGPVAYEHSDSNKPEPPAAAAAGAT